MKSSKEYRKIAGESLAGNYGVVIGAYILCTIALNILTAPLSIISGIGNLTGMIVASGIITIPVSLVISIVSTLFYTGVDKMVFDVDISLSPSGAHRHTDGIRDICGTRSFFRAYRGTYRGSHHSVDHNGLLYRMDNRCGTLRINDLFPVL